MTAATAPIFDAGPTFDGSAIDVPTTAKGRPHFEQWPIWVSCERCRVDRRLPAHTPTPHGLWYCEFQADPDAERCLPTANVPLRSHKADEDRSHALVAKTTITEVSEAHLEEMCNAFPRLKAAGIEQEVVLASGWVATYKKRKRGEGAAGDVYLLRPGEPPLRSAMDVRRRLGVLGYEVEARQTRGASTEDAELHTVLPGGSGS